MSNENMLDILPEYQALIKKLESVKNEEEYNAVVKEINEFRDKHDMKDYIDIED